MAVPDAIETSDELIQDTTDQETPATTAEATLATESTTDEKPVSTDEGSPETDSTERDEEQGDSAESQESGEPETNDRGEILLPEGIDYYDLDRDTRAGLRSLPKGLAENVGKRIIAAGQLLDSDPNRALAHALVARRLASRIAVVREAVGVAAYNAGQWQMAIGELRTAQRLLGTRAHIAMIADAERALGRPERAIDAYRDLDTESVEPEARIELLIVAAGARRDLDQGAAAVAMLQVPELKSNEPWAPRLQYAFADALADQGRIDEARTWFAKVAAVDEDDELGAAERLLELEGVEWVAEPDED
ncbi:hypothetical protein FB566_3763 [Stackebrandtia endophytica]|uniref:Tetratricopeptide repeat protein n=1 Tax=Stackebrandtia endophytica TaxID=1496996 RepID=A0A543B015_9ACTN|nr:hypothetical protein [Stackebrandtia endophytica]TQL78182.1 hypothetical protein FB566_3763 [Stackebrandtia endophytica]